MNKKIFRCHEKFRNKNFLFVWVKRQKLIIKNMSAALLIPVKSELIDS